MKTLILGGNRFFGRRLARRLKEAGQEVTILNRGNLDDGLGEGYRRLRADRTDESALALAIGDEKFDRVYDNVAFSASDARSALRVFEGRAERYILTSTQSVYGPGPALDESLFDARTYSFETDADPQKDYGEAKRQCEAVFLQGARFPVACVRMPIVLGLDDYTQRLAFHIRRIRDSEAIYFPNLNAKISFVNSEDAAAALEFIGDSDFAGSINVSSVDTIPLGDLMHQIEASVGKKIVLAKSVSEGEHSPFGIEQDWWMDPRKLEGLDYPIEKLESWLPALVQALCKTLLAR